MSSLLELWRKNKEFIQGKNAKQIVSMTGNGKLCDGNETSEQFREFLSSIPSSMLSKYVDECLTESFDDSGYVLQDLINQIGVRLGFDVENGLYRGKKGHENIGFDGIWSENHKYSFIIEVKTTDAYRINLDTIADYRQRLIENKKAGQRTSSILIVVGRKDTGDLEAQIRGSRHAWDVRLVSVDALLRLLKLKEDLNNPTTVYKIHETLKPLEFTRVDGLVDIVFSASEDIRDDDRDEENPEDDVSSVDQTVKRVHSEPVSFYDECLDRIGRKLNVLFIKSGRTQFTSADGEKRLLCLISKKYQRTTEKRKIFSYWFSIHPHQAESLREHKSSYIALGCGSSSLIFLFPSNVFLPLIDNMNKTEKENGKYYWHIRIFETDKQYLLGQPELTHSMNIESYIVRE